MRFLSLLILLLFISPSSAAEPTFKDVRQLLADYCVKCHGPGKQKGGLNLAAFADESAVLKQRKLWRRIIAQVERKEMPPEEEKQLTNDQRTQMLRWIRQSLDAADLADRKNPDPGKSVIRRLSRAEYNRTIRDLTGIDFDVASSVGMPDETVGEAFDNLADALNLNTTLMEKFFTAADQVLEKLYAEVNRKNPPKKKDKSPVEMVFTVRPVGEMSAREAARKLIEQFAGRAYRRPIEARELDRFVRLFDQSAKKEQRFEDAVKPMLKAVLVSPNFLLRIERDQPGDKPYRISDYELAVRLSYFLWSSMPDAELFTLAAKGELSRPEILEIQVRRMLKDPKAHSMTDYFATQWLHLRKLPFARPSTEFFPTFTHNLRNAMQQETTIFFDKLREEDRSLLELLDADYTYLNQDLAKHYGIDGVTGAEFRKVQLTDKNRGGLLGMSSILSLTSHTSRTSPTLRGKWILDVVLGTPPPPPPPDAGQIDENKRKGKSPKTFRELLAQHATKATCANCHNKIDPLGFGLENFDAIGRFRPSTPEIDPSGKLPNGERFNGAKELKQILLKRKSQFIQNLSSKMFIYAMGREILESDDRFIKEIADNLEKQNYAFSQLILGIVKSYPFQHRRNLRSEEVKP